MNVSNLAGLSLSALTNALGLSHYIHGQIYTCMEMHVQPYAEITYELPNNKM